MMFIKHLLPPKEQRLMENQNATTQELQDALVELAALLAEQEDAMVELAETFEEV